MNYPPSLQPKLFHVLLVMLLTTSELLVMTSSFPMTPQKFRSCQFTNSIAQLRHGTPLRSQRIEEEGYAHQQADQSDVEEFSSTSKKKEETSQKSSKTSKRVLQERKRKWVEDSTHYYTTVMRHDNRKARGQIRLPKFKEKAMALKYHRKNFAIAQNLYFARNQIKVGNLSYAESIYRKLVEELIEEDEADGSEPCKNAQLAISTLLLCLLLQRKHQITETRAAFSRFFRIISKKTEVEECACSAKVLQAYALFEMKQGYVKKSYELIQLAVQMDSELKPVLSWRQFRDAKALTSS